jgi:thermostable 8-oxoguanine DNA glycosylase
LRIARKWKGSLSRFLKDYRHQPDLTRRLDSSTVVPLDQATINEIVLWKVNRYVSLKTPTLKLLNGVAEVHRGAHRQAHDVLAALLRTDGVDLAMASTFLRFRNPRAFQIIDRHAYRAIYGHTYPLHGKSPLEAKRTLYFAYLDDLIDLAKSKDLEFEMLDRLLYMFDKKHNGPLKAAEQ